MITSLQSFTRLKKDVKFSQTSKKRFNTCFPANLGEVLTLFIATVLGWQILEPIHLLWINLVTDVFPAIALGLEEAEKDVMEQAPRGRSFQLLLERRIRQHGLPRYL